MQNHSQHVLPSASGRLGSDLKRDGGPPSRKREMQQEIVVAVEAKMAKSKRKALWTWPVACRSKHINGMISMMTSSSGNRRQATRASSPKTNVSLCKDVGSLFVNASRNLRISLRHVFGLGGHSGARGFISAQGAVDKPESQAIREETHNTQSFQRVVFLLDAIRHQ